MVDFLELRFLAKYLTRPILESFPHKITLLYSRLDCIYRFSEHFKRVFKAGNPRAYIHIIKTPLFLSYSCSTYYTSFTLASSLPFSSIYTDKKVINKGVAQHSLNRLHSNSPNPGALGPGTARNSEMSVSGNSQSSTSLYIISYRHYN